MAKKLFMAIALVSLCLLATPSSVFAKDLFTHAGIDCSKAPDNQSAVCHDHGTSTNPLLGPDGTLIQITNILAYIAGVAAVIMIIVSAIRFITSGSDISTSSRTDTDVENARHTLANAVIGLVVIVLGRTLIVFVVNKL